MQPTHREDQIVTERAREEAIQLLTAHFAADHLELGEFERRVDAVHRARTEGELRAIVADLPPVAPAAPTSPPPAPAPASAYVARPVDPAEVPTTRWIPAIIGGARRRGGWIPGWKNYALAIAGGIELDFRDIALPPGKVTEVTAVAVMGGVEIVVPPEVVLDVSGFAFMGGFEQGDHEPARYDPARPILRVRGVALMGGVEVQVRYPGETAKQARARRNAERRARQLPRS